MIHFFFLSIVEIFADIEEILSINLPIEDDSSRDSEGDDDNSQSISTRLIETINSVKPTEKIIIISNVNAQDIFNDRYVFNGFDYELCFCASIYNEVNDRYDAEVFCRHGQHFKNWWYQCFSSWGYSIS